MKYLLLSLLVTCSVIGKSQINVYLSVNPPTDANTCDGWVMAYTASGQAPYTYVWNDTDTSYGDSFLQEYDTLWNLCPGIYTLDLYDSNNDSIHLDFFLTSNDWSFGDSTGAADTIEFSVEDCTIDYSIPVDTAYLANVSIISDFLVTDADSIFVQWDVVQGVDTSEIFDTLIGYFPFGSDFMIDAGIYCPDSALKTQVKVIRILGVVEHNLGVTYIENKAIQVYPNPFIDQVTLKGIQSGEVVVVKIIDLQGKLLYREEKTASNNSMNISLSNLENGIYVMEVSESGRSYKSKLIKKN